MEVELTEDLPGDERGDDGDGAVFRARPVPKGRPAKDQAICIPEQEDG
jgi:hypothetical protein